MHLGCYMESDGSVLLRPELQFSVEQYTPNPSVDHFKNNKNLYLQSHLKLI